MAIKIGGTTVIDDSRNLTNLGSAITAAQGGTGLTSPGTAGNVLTSNGTTWVSQAPTGGGSSAKTWTSYTSSATYTVPTGVTSIRVYAVGAGSNAIQAENSQWNKNSIAGSGGGFAFGDLAVTAGQTVTITISGGNVTVSYAGVTRFTANKGTSPSWDNDNYTVTVGPGGTASIHASVTNGGAYLGGNSASFAGAYGGASAGSPAGNGAAANNSGGRSPIGAHGGNYENTFVNNASPTAPRALTSAYTDPLLANANGPGGVSLNYTSGSSGYPMFVPPSSGGGGASFSSRYNPYGQAGGDFGGGGAAATSDSFVGGTGTYNNKTAYAGQGGILAGGGAAYTYVNTNYTYGYAYAYGGSGGYGGGGGGTYASAYDNQYGAGYAYSYPGTGGPALVLIYA